MQRKAARPEGRKAPVARPAFLCNVGAASQRYWLPNSIHPAPFPPPTQSAGPGILRTHPANEDRFRSSIFLNDEELVPDPAAAGSQKGPLPALRQVSPEGPGLGSLAGRHQAAYATAASQPGQQELQEAGHSFSLALTPPALGGATLP